MIKSDYHIHTKYSHDSRADMRKYIDIAINKGLEEIVFTDHVETFDYNQSIDSVIDYSKYKKELAELEKLYSNKILIKLGAEINLDSIRKEELNDFIDKYEFDFIIGSMHSYKNIDIATKQYIENLDMDNYHSKYFTNLLECVSSGINFSVLGHLDYVARYGNFAEKKINFKKQYEYIREILNKVIELGKGIEINTSGLRYGLSEVHPSKEVLKLYKELGGDIITIGSDSHYEKNIGQDFDIVSNTLIEVGFKYYTRFNKMKPEFVKI